MTDRTIDLLKELRPADAERVDEVFPVAQRTALLEKILHSSAADHGKLRGAASSPSLTTRHRWQPSKRLAASGIGTLGAIGAVTALLVVSLASNGTATAFAGWTADPTTPASGQVQAAESYCERNPELASLSPTLTDTRGPYTLLVYAETGGGICIAGPSITAPTATPFAFSLGGVTDATPVAPDAILRSNTGEIVTAPTSPATSPAVAYSSTVGRVGVDVTAVTLTLADGTSVEATVANGWYAAWWPGSQAAQSAEITTASGTNTQQITPAPNGSSSTTG